MYLKPSRERNPPLSFQPRTPFRIGTEGIRRYLGFQSQNLVLLGQKISYFHVRVIVDNDTLNNFEEHLTCKFPHFGKYMMHKYLRE